MTTTTKGTKVNKKKTSELNMKIETREQASEAIHGMFKIIQDLGETYDINVLATVDSVIENQKETSKGLIMASCTDQFLFQSIVALSISSQHGRSMMPQFLVGEGLKQ